jgi:acetylornithine/succinyldiaminopimelate/putrescine aminotransferase
MGTMAKLEELRAYGGSRRTVGLEDTQIRAFLAKDSSLVQAIEEAVDYHQQLRGTHAEALRGDEEDLAQVLQEDLVNFYPEECVNPYVAIAGRGPWLITSHGAVLHDSGGYGMLGSGHAPQAVLEAMTKPWVMANVMTPSFSHERLVRRLRQEIGQGRDTCPYEKFICMNSGSESVTVSMRITDVNAMEQTGPGGAHEGKTPVFVALTGAFHGRTDRPAQISHSSLPKYRAFLHSFMARNNVRLVTPNDVADLHRVFAEAAANGEFVEAMFFEPVMGEGKPGEAVTRAFYDAARALTRAQGSFLVADSIQAGLRGTGFLSIVDYPGFEDCDPPDMETFSKALNAGQYPLSVLGMNGRAAAGYRRGIYGNTMTTNPRALEVACAVLDALTPEVRENIRARGVEFKEQLQALSDAFPGLITEVPGTGLLLACEIDPSVADVVGFEGLETWCRKHGIGVIHGGRNALRFTPHFNITSDEIDLICHVLRQAFQSVMGAAEVSRLEVADKVSVV